MKDVVRLFPGNSTIQIFVNSPMVFSLYMELHYRRRVPFLCSIQDIFHQSFAHFVHLFIKIYSSLALGVSPLFSLVFV